MSRRGLEAKPAWRDVPPPVRAEVERILQARVVRAERVYGGYAPSATFRMRLSDGRRAFFKGVNASSNEFMRRALEQEEKVYRELGALISPWAPAFLGGFKRDDWHVLLLEDVGPADVPPWTLRKVRDAARAYAEFHRSTLDRPLPEWVSRELVDVLLAESWERVSADPAGLEALAALAGERAAEARAWLDRALPALRESAARLASADDRRALLYLDARGDNVRWNHGRLRIFDWNWVAVGPPEPDAAAFAEGITSEDGRAPKRFMEEYAKRLSVRDDVVDASVAALAGVFARTAPRPPDPLLPRLRSMQRRQFKVCLAWAARRLGLPEPAWLGAVPS